MLLIRDPRRSVPVDPRHRTRQSVLRSEPCHVDLRYPPGSILDREQRVIAVRAAADGAQRQAVARVQSSVRRNLITYSTLFPSWAGRATRGALDVSAEKSSNPVAVTRRVVSRKWTRRVSRTRDR